MGYKYHLNPDMFDSWNENMAYILGFFSADGHLVRPKKNSGGSLIFSSKDIDVLNKIRSAMESNHSIYERTKNGCKWHELTICGNLLVNKLLKMGFTNNKSFNIPILDIPEGLLHHYIRGYFDGDGCICYVERNNRADEIVATFTSGDAKFLNYLSKSLHEIVGKRATVLRKEENCFDIRYNGKAVLSLFKYLYKNATIYMDRKISKFIESLYRKDMIQDPIKSDYDGLGILNEGKAIAIAKNVSITKAYDLEDLLRWQSGTGALPTISQTGV